MKLSIITINYNNILGLRNTAASIINQTNKNFEWIVIDGNSTDGAKDYLVEISPFITRWISEPDKGIYHAMNKGVAMAKGKYCLFMNSGDCLYNEGTVNEILQIQSEEDVIEGIYCRGDNPNIIFRPNKNINFSFYFFIRTNMHQATLIKRELLVAHPYDESYKIAGDKKMFVELLVVNNCPYRSVDFPICICEQNGISNTVKHDEERRRLFTEQIPERIIRDYEEFKFLHEWPISEFYPLLFKIGHSVRLLKLKIFLKRIMFKKIRPSEKELLKKRMDFNKDKCYEYHAFMNRGYQKLKED